MQRYRTLIPHERSVIEGKGTERPFSGAYCDLFKPGIYACRRCGAALYLSSDKFSSHCGWPSFDDEIKGAVAKIKDSDGVRLEILCQCCGAHLGHLFEGEGFTSKNRRHCVNSVSLLFLPATKEGYRRALFAGGCFWGVQHLFDRLPGVKETAAGYVGGAVANPSYEEVCQGNTGHSEAVEVFFDEKEISYEELSKKFLLAVRNKGSSSKQYRLAIFYCDEEQKKCAEELLKGLKERGEKSSVDLEPAMPFYRAEEYHQHYYEEQDMQPNCF